MASGYYIGHQRSQINIPAQISELQTGQSYCPTITKARNLGVIFLLTPYLTYQQILSSVFSKCLPVPTTPVQSSTALPVEILSSRALSGSTSCVSSLGPLEGALLSSIAWEQWGWG